MIDLDDYIYMLKQQGYSVMFREEFDKNDICVRLSKNGSHLEKFIPYNDMLNLLFDQETIKRNLLMDMKKELDENLKAFENPRWTDYQVKALTDISECLRQYAHGQTSESVRLRFESLATEVKNVIPMEMVRKNGS